MANETTITLIGNLVDDPELRFTPSGHAVARFRVASTPRVLDKQSGEWKDGNGLYLTCNAWRKLGENVAESLQRGTRVIVQGRLQQRSYETKEGEKRTVMEVEVDDVALSLKFDVAKVDKTKRERRDQAPWPADTAPAPAMAGAAAGTSGDADGSGPDF
ncbi:single-stranded DNA-binding protein [Streptosporangium canum]|uniref:single-stranded DNA-binding protein n=1 Tax=Streptosporangium canum TaxID=324952 RepID=UPI003681124D